MIVRGVRGRACSIWSSRSPSQGRRLLPPLLSRSIASVPSSSVNEDEVRKFGGYGSSWWDQASRKGAGPLHSMNPVRVEYLVNRVGSLRGVSVLDVGCGGGILSESLARMGAIVTGIDPSVHNIDVARQHAGVDPLTRGICYEKATAEEMLAAGDTYDLVIASEVIEHVQDPTSFVRTLSGLVRTQEKGGHLFLSTINRTLKSYVVAILGAEKVTKLVPAGTHHWSSFIQPQELARMLRDSGLRVADVHGMVYNPINNTWRLAAAKTDVNYILHARKDA